MDHTILAVLLVACCLVGLALIAVGLPGIWLMVVAVIAYGLVTKFAGVGVITLSVTIVLALLSEVAEAWLGFGLARKYGGSKRAGWGALIGGLVGAAVGVPVPVVGSVIGSLVGAFGGALLLEYLGHGDSDKAVRAGFGALLGRVAATATKMALGFVITVLAVIGALRG
ncbi:MAG TPA: DUF456 domain-containing protein [Gemmatimonadales bacterium]|jgi:uncharacterized protein YqgC (DUF456 family)|nr:DUF456 domain-containing protein [Gemmatimonadales bacterium]